MSLIEVNQLEFSYTTDVPTLRGFDLHIEAGSVVGLLGRNGAGKTTLLRALMGLMRPGKGTVKLFGADPVKEPIAVKQRIGYVSEDQILPEAWSLRQIVAMHREVFPNWDVEFAEELMVRFQIPGNKRVQEMSKGQARQVALLCAVAHRPELLILDEPGSGVDPVMRRELLETAIELLADSGSTILFSSHHVGDVERLANRIVVMDYGQVVLDAELDDLKEGYCVVTAPQDDEAARRLRGTPGFLSLRVKNNLLRAVFAASPEDLAGKLAGIPGAGASRVALEDLFIDLVGGAI